MDYLTFLNTLQKEKMGLFTLQDIAALFPNSTPKTIKNNLGNWTKKGYINRLKRNLYEFVTSDEKQLPDFYLANKLYSPSYVSLEAALSFYDIIPGEAAEVTSVTTKPTRSIRNDYGIFTYRSCKKEAFLGYRLMKIRGRKAFIADREKALVDFIYYRLREGETDFSGERFNLSQIRVTKARSYAKRFNQKTLKTMEGLL